MKRNFTLFLAFFAISLFASKPTVSINDVQFEVDTLAQYKVGPGTHYTSLRMTTSYRRLDVHFLKIDRLNEYVTYRAALGRDSILLGEGPTEVAARKSKPGAVYFAGSNGDFYSTTGYVGLPVGTTMVDDQLARTPNNTRKLLAFDADKNVYLGSKAVVRGEVHLSDTTLKINNVNHLRGTDALVLYNEHNGTVTRTNQYGTEVLIELTNGDVWGVNKTLHAKVLAIEKDKGGMAIPKGKAVLSANGSMQGELNKMTVGQEITFELGMTIDDTALAYTMSVGGDSRKLMLDNGVVEQGDVWDERHPRTGFGYSKDKEMIIQCVVDGRGLSSGCTTLELAEIMQSAGAYNAINLDGGGSSCLFAKDFGQLNNPSDGSGERAVSNGVYVVSSAPEDAVISELIAYKPRVTLPRYGTMQPDFLAYNQYGTLLDKDVQGVVLSCEPEVGEVLEDGKFMALGNGVLTATYQGIVEEIQITVAENTSYSITLDSVLVDNRRGYDIELNSIVDGQPTPVSASVLDWTIEDETICSIEEGVLIGLKNGTTKVVGMLGTLKDDLIVHVQIPEGPSQVWSDFKTDADQWSITKSSAFSDMQLKDGAIEFTYKSTRGPYFKLQPSLSLYGLPDSIQLHFNTGGAQFSKIIMGIRTNTETQAVAFQFDDVTTDGDVCLSVATSDLQPTKDTFTYGIFPLWLDYLTFNLATGMQKNQVYTIPMHSITLCYDGVDVTYLPSHTVNSLQVYPNPTVGNTICITNYSDDVKQIQLFDLQGHMLRNEHADHNETHINISSLAAGTYFVRVGSETVKIIKR